MNAGNHDSPINGELDDLARPSDSRLGQFDVAALASPLAIRAIAIMLICLVALVWPDRDARLLGRLVGLALLVTFSGLALNPVRKGNSGFVRLATSGLISGLGLFLIVAPPGAKRLLGLILGLSVAGLATRRLVLARRKAEPSYLVAGAQLVLAAALVGFPEQTISSSTMAIALAGLGFSGLVIGLLLSGRIDSESVDGAVGAVRDWLLDRPKSADARGLLYDKILFEGPDTERRVVRFFVLMGFASVIASMGVLTDSTAVVIGAMLVAPLMTPLMGMAISLVMGWPNRMAMSATIAIGGIAFAIAVSVLIGLTVPLAIATDVNSQIVARSSPTVLDLLTALAAGSAGAYGLSRPDVSDALPGVAIAISLVPPLSVAGISYSQGDWASGNGALLLFATNMVAILAMGGLTFVVTGVTPVEVVAENQHRMRTWVGSLVTMGALVMAGLFINGSTAASNLLRASTIDSDVADWLDDAPQYRLIAVETTGDEVKVTVIGPAEGLPPVADLADDLGASLGRHIVADVRLVVEERTVASSDG